MARNLLLAADLMQYQEPIILPQEGLKGTQAGNSYSFDTEKHHLFEIRPNPASDYTVVEYRLQETGNAKLMVADTQGNPIFLSAILELENQLLIDTRDWRAGVYVVWIELNGLKIDSQKLNITK